MSNVDKEDNVLVKSSPRWNFSKNSDSPKGIFVTITDNENIVCKINKFRVAFKLL